MKHILMAVLIISLILVLRNYDGIWELVHNGPIQAFKYHQKYRSPATAEAKVLGRNILREVGL